MKEIENIETLAIYTVGQRKAVLVTLKFSDGTEKWFFCSEDRLKLISSQLSLVSASLNQWEVQDN